MLSPSLVILSEGPAVAKDLLLAFGRCFAIPLPCLMNPYTRDRAWEVLTEWTQSSSLLKHALAVEACTEFYGSLEAERLGLSGEEAAALTEKYAITGLLHDFDYDRHPSLEEHPFVGEKVLAEQGWPEEIRRAILSHADYSGVPRETHLERSLFACDELAGFLTACALVKPSKSIFEVEVAGVKKKMKDKAFARAVKREDMTLGAELLSLPLDDHIDNCLKALQARAEKLGLKGTAA